LFPGDLDVFLMHISSKKQSPTAAPSPDCQAIGNPADPALRVFIGGQPVPLRSCTDERLLYKIPGLGGIASDRGDLDDEPVPACPIQLVEIVFRMQTASFTTRHALRGTWVAPSPRIYVSSTIAVEVHIAELS
jgi:hypothetical protein